MYTEKGTQGGAMMYLSSKSGKTISGRTRERLWKETAASMVPNLLNIAIRNAGRRHFTNASMSVADSLACSGVN